jgi:DUF4097 and DUF4098 domain-containing protein YvlB
MPLNPTRTTTRIALYQQVSRKRMEWTNGGITAIVRRPQGDEPLEFETVNGGITLQLPADLEARTTNGTIATDFPITVDGGLSSRRLTGRIGRGGRQLRVRTVNGSIRLQALP